MTNWLSVRRGPAVFLAMVLLAGCADKPHIMRFQMPAATGNEQLMWPRPPDQPRLLYIGDLVGEGNIEEAEDTRSGLLRLLEAIGGIRLGERKREMLVRPQNGVVDAQGRILVTDVGRPGVFVFDETQGTLSVWSEVQPGVSFVAPTGITLGAQNEILVADAELKQVVALGPDGTFLRSIGEGGLMRPTGVAYDPRREQLLVADTGADEIKIFNNQGHLVDTIGRLGEGEGDLNSPVYMALHDDRLYVADTLNARIQVYDGEGKFLQTIGRRGLVVGNLTRPKGVALDSDANLYVIESYYDHLLIFNQEGELLLPIGGSGVEAGRFFLPAGVWIDGRNRVFVADMLNGRVSIFQYMETDS